MATELRWIPGYEGKYMVSSVGDVISTDYMRSGQPHYLKQTWDGRYYKVGLAMSGETKTWRTHQLVALAFLPPPGEEETTIDHIDGDRKNNLVSNLRYCSIKDNIANPNTLPNMRNRYHREGEWERRSAAQKKRFREHPESHGKRRRLS